MAAPVGALRQAECAAAGAEAARVPDEPQDGRLEGGQGAGDSVPEQIRAQQAAEAAQKAAEQQVEAIFPSHELSVFLGVPVHKLYKKHLHFQLF